MQKSNHICYNTSKYACFKPYNTYTNSMLKYCKKVVKKACNLQLTNNTSKILALLYNLMYNQNMNNYYVS